MEQLTYNRFGQWTLNKVATESAEAISPCVKDNFDDRSVGETPTYSNEHNQSFRNINDEGSLKRDYGEKGSLHGNPPSRSPKHMSRNKAKGKVPVPTTSRNADNNPGLKSTT